MLKDNRRKNYKWPFSQFFHLEYFLSSFFSEGMGNFISNKTNNEKFALDKNIDFVWSEWINKFQLFLAVFERYDSTNEKSITYIWFKLLITHFM